MEDLKLIIAKNIVMLRRRDGMTQFELAQRLNYSDKAVSKWERGESVPDIAVLKALTDIRTARPVPTSRRYAAPRKRKSTECTR